MAKQEKKEIVKESIDKMKKTHEKMQEEIKDKKDLESIKEKIDKGSETVEKKTKAAVEEI